jgi:3,4-dihydroxy 2-butanone 4-phosphate synthase/GTP cyclohydrolase II
LIAKDGGVLRRTGHTEAAIDLARLAGLKPAGVIVEIMNEDGTMARLPQLKEVAEKFDLKIVSIEDLVAYRMDHDSLIEKKENFELVTRFGTFRLHAYNQTNNNQIHIALTKGSWNKDEHILTRINSTLINNDILGTLTNNVDKKLEDMFKVLNESEKGAIIFINQQMQSMDLLNRLKDLRIDQDGNSLVKAPRIKIDYKDFGVGAQILHDLNISKARILTNNPSQKKRVGMVGYGLEIVEYVPF